MEFDLAQAEEALERAKAESRDPSQMIADNSGIPNPVSTESLTQMMLGAPGIVYNGGLLRATIRYFDADTKRANLPADVSALVDQLGPNIVGFQLVNLSRSETRRIIVQAGAFGEHQFTSATHGGTTSTVDSKYIEVTLSPGASAQVKCGLNRFVNQPSYAMPW